ncbi:interleukin-10 receptor subunit alpha [Dunckerocampus dactyliophorus]|uniref:interleukin-10 receptor subunit alpha n=1 Tax=Dunckerocampus dactyliophorus TaxID=161453 RepID=UPI002404E7F5|nr:interleukin-10 receptor subunit alpha [Dunckerocampus dactyliophorus]
MPLCNFMMTSITMSHKTLVIAFMLLSNLNCGSGQDVKLSVNVLDGEVIVLWNKPRNATSDIQYNVQLAKYAGEWDTVGGCTGTTKTYCDLSSLIHDYSSAYKVAVQTVDRKNTSEWTVKKFLPNASKLQPPSFTLYATSSTITVHVHQKPVLRKLFPFGVTYIMYLEENGHDDKKTISYLTDGLDQRSKTFTSLRWGVEYCVSIMVEGNGALSTSNFSPKQCLRLPEQEWFIIAVSSLTALAMLAVVSVAGVGLLYHLNRPAKTPDALKCLARDWQPLTVGEGTMEVVIDKGWFLSGRRTEVKTFKEMSKNPVALHILEEEAKASKDRRTSLDSGVSLGSTEGPRRQEDSDCGSMGGPEGSRHNGVVYPQQNDTGKRKEDSGVGLRCKLDSSFLTTTETFGSYHSHSPVLRNHVGDQESKQILPCVVLAEAGSGYRAGPQSCICSGAAQCTWCLRVMAHEAETTQKHRGLLSKDYFLDGTRWSTTAMSDLETREAFPLLTALREGMDHNMNSVAKVSLCDLQLNTE